MAIFGSTQKSRMITMYEADPTNRIKGIKKIGVEDKKLTKQVQQGSAKQGGALKGLTAGYGSLVVKVFAVVAAYKALKSASSEALKDAQLQQASSGVSMDGLKDAAEGLISEVKLLEFAAATMNTEWAITQKEQETVIKGMLSLRKQGNDLDEVIGKVTDALVQGKVKGLAPFGVILEATKGTAEAHTVVLEALGEQAKLFGGDYSIAGDELVKASTRAEDAFRGLEISAGKAVVALSPLITVLSLIAEGLAEIGNFEFGAFVRGDETKLLTGRSSGELKKEFAEKRSKRALAATRKSIAAVEAQFFGTDATSVLSGLALSGGIGTASKARKGKGGKGGGSAAEVVEEIGAELLEVIALGSAPNVGPADFDPATGLRFNEGTFIPGEFESLQAQLEATLENERARRASAAASLKKSKDDHFLKQMFGDVREFSVYADGFKILDTAASAAFGALITGSAGVGEAFKNALGDVMLGVSMDMFGQGIRHAAWAVGSLAFHDPVGAQAHGIASAQFFAGAAATGFLANQLGAGQAPSASAGGGGSAGLTGRPSLASGSGESGLTVVQVINGEDGNSPRRQAANSTRNFERAQRLARGTRTVVHR